MICTVCSAKIDHSFSYTQRAHRKLWLSSRFISIYVFMFDMCLTTLHASSISRLGFSFSYYICNKKMSCKLSYQKCVNKFGIVLNECAKFYQLTLICLYRLLIVVTILLLNRCRCISFNWNEFKTRNSKNNTAKEQQKRQEHRRHTVFNMWHIRRRRMRRSTRAHF